MARQLDVRLTVDDVAALRVSGFVAREEVLRPAVVEVEAFFGGDSDIEALIGRKAELWVGTSDENGREFFGIVEEAEVFGSTELGADTKGTRYLLRVVEPVALLARSVDSRIFQDMTVNEIVTKVLNSHGISDLSWGLLAEYPKREYCVQYQESALAFITRLLEEEGIYYFYEPKSDGGFVLTFADDSASSAPIAGSAELFLRGRAALNETEDAIYALREREQVRSGKFVLRDYDFKRPMLDLTAEAEASERTELEVYDFPGAYTEPGEGARLAEVRLCEEQVQRHTLTMEALCPRIAPGHQMKVCDASELDGDYFIMAAIHKYSHKDDGDSNLMVQAELLPLDICYRPPRRTPRPVIWGPQTATVVAPSSAEQETIHTDEHGRCKVKFHWDRSDILDDKASCWMRVAQLQTSGSMVLPRLDWEVVVEFLEGNPDRPIVTGRLFNGLLMPPYALPEGRTRSALRTSTSPGGGGSNEIRLEDKAGAEEIMMHAQYDMTINVANNSTSVIGNNSTQMVGNNASLSVGGNQASRVTMGNSNTIGVDQSVSVGGNRNVEVNAVSAIKAAGNATTSVGGNQFEMDGNPLKALLDIAAEAAAEFASQVANHAIANVQAQVDGAINQAMGPINALQGRAQQVGAAMQALSGGDLSAFPGAVSGASQLPGAAQVLGQMSQAGGDARAANNAAVQMAQGAARGAIAQATAAARGALGAALGVDGGGGGGSSAANVGGPAGDVSGVDGTDRETGPGHATALIGGSYTEDVGANRVLAAIKDIDTNINGSMTESVGAATVQIAVGNYAESVGGSKTESALGLVVLAKGDETEQAGGSMTKMVGGAIFDKVKGGISITAGGPATFIGAFHKIEAANSITLSCGASTVTIDGGGITIASPIVTITAGKVTLKGAVSEV